MKHHKLGIRNGSILGPDNKRYYHGSVENEAYDSMKKACKRLRWSTSVTIPNVEHKGHSWSTFAMEKNVNHGSCVGRLPVRYSHTCDEGSHCT